MQRECDSGVIRRRFSFSFVLCAALLALPACREEALDRAKITDLTLLGVEQVDEGRIRDALATRESSNLPWGESRYFEPDQFQADLQRITALYTDLGYPDAEIADYDLTFNEAQDEVRISITIQEGEPVIVAEVGFRGFDVLPPDQFSQLQDRVPIQAGEPRSQPLIQAGRDLAAQVLADHGYPYAQVEARLEEAAEGAVAVQYVATPGTQATFGAIEIVGNSSVDDDVIRRQLTFRPGNLFQLGEVRASQRKLYGLELFQFVNIEPVDQERRPAEVPTRVTVTEGDHRRLTFGLGYGSEEKVRAQAEWRHVNFFGAARTARVEGKWSSLSRGVRFDFRQPYLFHPNWALTLNGQRWFADEPAYELDSIGGRITATRQTVKRDPLTQGDLTTSQSISYIHEVETFAISNEALNDLSFRDELIALGLDPRTGTGEGTLSALALDAQRDTTGNLLNASSGYRASVHIEQAGYVMPGTFDFYELSGELRHYWTVARRFVVANRVQFGSIDGRGEETGSVPFFKRYFLGGSTSLRGWGRFEVSPLSGSGLPIGGHSVFLFSTELRAPVFGDLGGVLFVDGGNVWTDPWRVNLDDLRYAVGPGLRYNTPIGPVRVDFGYQLNPLEGLIVNGEPETRRWRVHFSIGQAF